MTPIKTRSTLVDITKCIGCRACQVACKQWNDKDGEQTELQPDLGFQNPAVLSAKTLTLISFHEIEDQQAPGGLAARPAQLNWLTDCIAPVCADRKNGHGPPTF